MKYWLGVVSKEHVMRGVEEGFAQVCDGKAAPLARMSKGDGLVFYSPVYNFGGKDKLQAFTAIGVVKDDKVYQYQMIENFIPYRRNINFLESKEVPIIELKNELSITQGNYGMLFRPGHLQVPEIDFQKIANAMGVSFQF